MTTQRAAGVLVAAVSATVISAGACEFESGDPAQGTGRQSASPGATKAKKQPTRRPRTEPRVVNVAQGRKEQRRVRLAVVDLRRLGVWKKLTRHLHIVKIGTRPGVERIPGDGHLADAVFTFASRDHSPTGLVCDIVFFSSAMSNDVARQAQYYAQGALDHEPPTLREFWAVVLAHELAHCDTPGQKGEAYSERWEKRILAKLGKARAGS